jgi:two-component sensor histidine kinase
MNAFSPVQVKMTGADIMVSPKHALALSLALHELATNATKYGALSHPEGRVALQWDVDDTMLHLNWEESAGPPVAPPVRKGFGTRLLEDILIRDLGGHTKLDYEPSGLRCHITAEL